MTWPEAVGTLALALNHESRSGSWTNAISRCSESEALSPVLRVRVRPGHGHKRRGVVFTGTPP